MKVYILSQYFGEDEIIGVFRKKQKAEKELKSYIKKHNLSKYIDDFDIEERKVF